MPRIEGDHVVEQIPATVANPTLGNAVLPRATEAGPLWPDAEAFQRIEHFALEVCVAVKDQIVGRRIVGECVAQPLGAPSPSWMPGHIAVNDTPPIMRYGEETIENAKLSFGMVKKSIVAMASRWLLGKSRPSPCRLRTPWRPTHPGRYGSFRNVEAQHFQFTMNERCTPSRVLGDHAKDEFAQFSADALPVCLGLVPREPSAAQARRPKQLGSKSLSRSLTRLRGGKSRYKRTCRRFEGLLFLVEPLWAEVLVKGDPHLPVNQSNDIAFEFYGEILIGELPKCNALEYIVLQLTQPCMGVLQRRVFQI
jgi:hypothetical protein